MKKNNKITIEKINKYHNLTSKALMIAKKAVAKGKEKQAKEIFLMVECYLSDALHFKEKKDFVNSYGALNYAHGWLDCGARLKVYIVTDNKLFTV
ncbi:DUF357 domain-containing protein [Candidatus Pacearchaeota archaeon]|nr:DUF357 domain-containing protein [Candidatus Pacearchaeota archaeon]